jgi:hypothetical protein
VKDVSVLPPPVTRNSSKSELWEELECVRREVDAQQNELIEARQLTARNASELTLLRYQVRAMRAVLDIEAR